MAGEAHLSCAGHLTCAATSAPLPGYQVRPLALPGQCIGQRVAHQSSMVDLTLAAHWLFTAPSTLSLRVVQLQHCQPGYDVCFELIIHQSERVHCRPLTGTCVN